MRIKNRKGIWSISKTAIIIFMVLMLTILYTIYVEYSKLQILYHTIDESIDIAHIIDSVGMCPSYCSLNYTLPNAIYDKSYHVYISNRSLSIKVQNPDDIIIGTNLIHEVSGNVELSDGCKIIIIKKSVYAPVEVIEK